MKRKLNVLYTLLLTVVMSVCTLVGCNKNGSAKAEIVSKTETMVVIKINETEGFATLLDAMNYLKDEGELTFEMDGTMVSAIEGKANPADFSACWMLYTSHAEMSNTEWGTITYEENTYSSAIVGADSLTIMAGEYYVWSYQTF